MLQLAALPGSHNIRGCVDMGCSKAVGSEPLLKGEEEPRGHCTKDKGHASLLQYVCIYFYIKSFKVFARVVCLCVCVSVCVCVHVCGVCVCVHVCVRVCGV